MTKHSNETKRKISHSVRRTNSVKKYGLSPTQARMEALAEGFKEGHPEGLEVNTVRNYGDLGKDTVYIGDEPIVEIQKDERILAYEEQKRLEAEKAKEGPKPDIVFQKLSVEKPEKNAELK